MNPNHQYEATILVADDNPENIALLQNLLEQAQYRVRVATDGSQVLERVAAELPDLIVLDVHMPILDGYETCIRLKSDPTTSRIPVLFLSGLDEVFNKVQAFNCGGADYVTKPFHAEELLARIKAHLNLYRYEKQIETLYTELKQNTEKLIEMEKWKSISNFIASLAHELNNPLNFILLSSEVLKKDVESVSSLIEQSKEGLSSNQQELWENLRAEIALCFQNLSTGLDRSIQILRTLIQSTKPEIKE